MDNFDGLRFVSPSAPSDRYIQSKLQPFDAQSPHAQSRPSLGLIPSRSVPSFRLLYCFSCFAYRFNFLPDRYNLPMEFNFVFVALVFVLMFGWLVLVWFLFGLFV